MNSPDNTLSMLRHVSEETRRQRLEEAYKRYQSASARYRALLRDTPDDGVRSPDDDLAAALRAESETLSEYWRLMKIVTDLGGRGGKHVTQSQARKEKCDGDFSFSG